MKVKVSLVSIIVFLLFFLDSYCFYIFRFNGVLSQIIAPKNKYSLLLLLIFYFVLKKVISIKYFDKSLIPLYAYLLVFIFLMSIYSMLKYQESLMDVFTCWHSYIVIFSIIPFLEELRDENEFFLDLIVWMSVIFCLLILIHAFCFNVYEQRLLPGLIDDFFRVRNNRLRIDQSNIVKLSIPIMIANIFNGNIRKRSRIYYFIGLVIVITANIYVFMSRSAILIYIGVGIFIYFVNSQKKKGTQLLLFLAITIAFLQFVDVEAFFETFSENSIAGTGLSTTVRIQEVRYYMTFFTKNPLFGLGFIRDGLTDIIAITRGSYGYYYLTDVGIFGLVGECGLLGAILFTLFSWKLVKDLKYVIQKRGLYSDRDVSLAVGFVLYWFLSSINWIVTNQYNTISMAFIVSFVHFLATSPDYYKFKSGTNNMESQTYS